MNNTNYVNEKSIYGFMNNYASICNDYPLSYWKTKSHNKLIVCKNFLNIKQENIKEIDYMYLDENPNIKGSSKIHQICSLIDSTFLEENINRKNHREIFETYRKWSNKIIVIENNYEYIKENYDNIINMIEKWRYSCGMKYKWQERAGVDKAFFKRYVDNENNFKDNFIVLIFIYNNEIIGYSINPNNISYTDNEIQGITYLLRKCLIQDNEGNNLRNITEYVDWYTFVYLMKYFNINQLIINWGCSTKGVAWYKMKKWPLYKLEYKWFLKIKN